MGTTTPKRAATAKKPAAKKPADHGGPMMFIKPAKAHVSVGHFKLHDPSELDEGALASMVRDAVRLNREMGSPAKRGAA